jgi:hypothetical protein
MDKEQLKKQIIEILTEFKYKEEMELNEKKKIEFEEKINFWFGFIIGYLVSALIIGILYISA